MPRDSGGAYTLSPSGNPVVSGTTIQPNWANPTMDDLAAALTDSLSRTGQGNMLVPFRVPDGSAVAPSFSFLNNVLSGLYLFAVNDVRMSVNGVDLARYENGKIQQWDPVNMEFVGLLDSLAGSVPILFHGNITNPLVDLKLKNSIDFTGVGAPTFTRASTATYIDRYGVVQSAAIDEIRFEAEGALLEGVITNLALRSEEFDDAVWTIGAATVTPNSTISPDGAMTADSLIEDSTSSPHQAIQIISFISGTTYTASIFLKSGSGSRGVRLRLDEGAFPADAFITFNPETGDITSQGAGVISSGSKTLANGWIQFFLIATANATGVANLQIQLTESLTSSNFSYLGDSTGFNYLFGMQVEALTFNSSYIPTGASPVARAADFLSVTAINNHPKVATGTPLSIVCDFDYLGVISGGVQSLLEVITAVNSRLRMDSGRLNYFRAAVTSNILDPVLANISARTVVTVGDTDIVKGYFDGIQTVSEVRVPVSEALPTEMFIGNSELGFEPLFGHISRLQIFDRELSEFESSIV